jgi:hypothetical protein
MPSFDIVSRTDLNEVNNAVQGATREIPTRYDFKGSNCSIERSDVTLVIKADDDFKLKQVQELLRGHLARRKLDAGAFEFGRPEKRRLAGRGQSFRPLYRSDIQPSFRCHCGCLYCVREPIAAQLIDEVTMAANEVWLQGDKLSEMERWSFLLEPSSSLSIS